MKTLIATIKISRPINMLITFAVVIVAAIISSKNLSISFPAIYAGLSAMLVAAAGNIINDYFDFEIDKINRPNRVLPSGMMSKKTALLLYFVISIAALVLSYLVSVTAIIIVLLTTAILFLYSKIFKGVPLVGNILIATCTGLAFIYGGVTVGNWEAAIIPSVFAFLINFIRELLKDIEDLEGDLQNKTITFAGKFGVKKTKSLILNITAILILATFYPFVSKVYSIEYFMIVLFTVNLILVYFLKGLNKENFLEQISKLSNYLKLSMVFGLIAIYFG
ncbi:MAG: UbiA family prenyltransferase [Ignavibacteriae bacterium]|nr:UbiA family prenyltransferase [Ignavibacteriota bacterium]